MTHLIGGVFLIVDLVMEDFVPFSLAKKLEEKGFQIEFKYALGYYDTRGQFMIAADHWFLEYWTIAPTISQVLKWLREEKKIFVAIDYYPAGYNAMIYTGLSQKDGFCDNEQYIDECDCCNTYELAALAGIEYVINNLI